MHLEWRRIPSNPHPFPPWGQMTDLGPHQARIMCSCDTANDAQWRYITIHECDRPDKLLSISIDSPIPRRRQSRALSTRFHCPSSIGQKPSRTRLQASARAQIRQSAVLELSCLSGKAYPKRGPRGWRIVIAVVSASARQSRFEVELDICVSSCFHRGRGPVTLSLCSRQGIKPNEAQMLLPPWSRPGVAALGPWVWLFVPPWARPGDVALDRAVWLSFRAVWSRLRSRSSQILRLPNHRSKPLEGGMLHVR
jgi:hypothetical protein